MQGPDAGFWEGPGQLQGDEGRGYRVERRALQFFTLSQTELRKEV